MSSRTRTSTLRGRVPASSPRLPCSSRCSFPVAAAEWASGSRPLWTASAVAGKLYLAVVITAIGYVAWNWALARVPAPRAALFLNVQPIAGALLGAALLGEPVTIFTLAGGAAIVAGLGVVFGRRRP